MRLAIARWLSAVYPVVCGGCGAQGIARLCAVCLAAWPALGSGLCPGCALPEGAHACPAGPTAFSATYAAAAHAGVARQAVHALKFRGQRRMARALAPRLREAVGALGPEWLVSPIPLHRERRRERGYDQAELLARALAREGGWRFARPLRRVRATRPSHGLGRAARARNLEAAFGCEGPIVGRRFLLVDDVLTTGATAQAAAGVLIAAGAAEVRLAVVARRL